MFNISCISKLFQNAKIQDLNVIHNWGKKGVGADGVVSECKDTRFECNSQPQWFSYFYCLLLFQNAKIQDLNVIHNLTIAEISSRQLFQNAKIQDLNVIHNINASGRTSASVVSECKDTRFECNSQLKFRKAFITLCCFRMQRYKIWM